MISLQVEIEGVTPDSFNLKGLQEYAVKEVGVVFYNRVAKLASERLKTSKNTYLSGLRLNFTRDRVSIYIVGVVPNMIEGGASAFDMKLGFMRNAIPKKGGGWYLTIPFFFKNFLGKQEETQILSTDEATSLIPPISKSKEKTIQESTQIIKNGVILKSKKYEEFVQKHMKGENQLIASQTRERNRGSVVQNFRRVSDRSRLNSWIHKGIQARNFLGETMKDFDIDRVANNAAQAWLNDAF